MVGFRLITRLVVELEVRFCENSQADPGLIRKGLWFALKQYQMLA